MKHAEDDDVIPWWIWLCIAVLVLSGPVGMSVLDRLTGVTPWAYVLAVPTIVSLVIVGAYFRNHVRN